MKGHFTYHFCEGVLKRTFLSSFFHACSSLGCSKIWLILRQVFKQELFSFGYSISPSQNHYPNKSTGNFNHGPAGVRSNMGHITVYSKGSVIFNFVHRKCHYAAKCCACEIKHVLTNELICCANL